MNRRLTTARLIVALISTPLEEVAIYVIWRWLLPEFDIVLPVSVLIGVMVAWAIFSILLFLFTTQILKRQVTVGLPSMIGAKGKVASSLNPEGLVRIKNELWVSTSTAGTISKGEVVEVIEEDGLKLVVQRTGDRPKR